MIERMKSIPQLPLGLCGGVWWCLACQAPAELADPGEPQPLCARCSHRRVIWQPNESRGQTAEIGDRRPEIVPDDAQPMLSVRKLPSAERPKLTEMAFAGYWLCLACAQPTKKDDQDCCVLCGSSQVEFQEPTL